MENHDLAKLQLQTILNQFPGPKIENLYLQVPEWSELGLVLGKEDVIKGYLLGNLEGSYPGKRPGRWLVVATESKFLFLQKSLISDLFHFEIKYENLRSISGKAGWFFGEINLELANNFLQVFQIGKKDYSYFKQTTGEKMFPDLK
jgi:hypothetical protein